MNRIKTFGKVVFNTLLTILKYLIAVLKSLRLLSLKVINLHELGARRSVDFLIKTSGCLIHKVIRYRVWIMGAFCIGLTMLFCILFYIDYSRSNTREPAWEAKFEEYYNLDPQKDIRNYLQVHIKDIDANASVVTLDLDLSTNNSQIISSSDVEMTIYDSHRFGSGPLKYLDLVDVPLEKIGEIRKDTIFKAQDISVGIISNKRPYPFDEYSIDLQFSPSYKYLSEDRIDIRIHFILVKMGDKEFVSTRKPFHSFNPAEYHVYRYNYIRAQVLIILILTLGIISWSFFQIIKRLNAGESAFDILGLNIGILLALHDIRSLIIPKNLLHAPLIDFSLSLVCILSLLSVFTYIARASKAKTN